MSALAALASGAGIVIVALAARTRRARYVEHEVHTRLPRHEDGLVIGADPIELTGGKNAVLILHGFGDTPQSVRMLAERLHARGWTVRVPLLPGHGRTLGEFAGARASEWIGAARDAYASLRIAHHTVAVVGQSMGGALAMLVAAEHPEIPAIVLLAPYLTMMDNVRRIARQQRVLSLLLPYVRARNDASIWDPVEKAKSLGYGVTPTRLLAELARITRAAWDIAPTVRTPTLMLQSRQDNRIGVADAQRVFDRLGGRPKDLQWLDGCGHVIAVDHCRDRVWTETARWLWRFGGADSVSE